MYIHQISLKVLIVWMVCLVLVGIALVHSFMFSGLHFSPYPFIDTVFASDFTWEKFDFVESGMTKKQIKGTLGEPLSKSEYGFLDPGGECWQYSDDGKLWPKADFSYYLVQVCFRNGVVENKPVNEFRI